MKKKKPIIKRDQYTNLFSQEKWQKLEDGTDNNVFRDALKIALETRTLEINLYWKRSTYFVAFISVVFIGFYNVDGKEQLLKTLLAGLGFLLSVLWYAANRASKFWQENWEAHIKELSIKLGIPIFGIIKKPEHAWREMLSNYPYSVSKINQMISILISIAWIFILIPEVYISLGVSTSCCKLLTVIITLIVCSTLSWVLLHICRNFAASDLEIGSNDFFDNYSESQ